MQLLSDLGTHLSGITVDGLTASQDDIVLLDAVGIDSGGNDLGGSVGVGTAELTGGDQNAFVHAHGHQLTQHALGGRRTHGERHDLAAQLILQSQSGLDSVQVIGVDDGLHGRTIQRTIGIDSDFAAGVGNLLYGNQNLHCLFPPLTDPCWRRSRCAAPRKCPRKFP